MGSWQLPYFFDSTNSSRDRAEDSQETPITRCFVDIKINKVSFAKRLHALPFFISAAGLVHHFDAGKVPGLPFLSTAQPRRPQPRKSERSSCGNL